MALLDTLRPQSQTKGTISKIAGTLQGPRSDISTGSDIASALLSRRDSQLFHKSKDNQLRAFHNIPPFFLANQRIAVRFAMIDWTFFVDGEETQDHPVVRAHNDPNPFMTGFHFRSILTKYLNILGRWNVVMIPSGEGDEVDFWPIPPTDCSRNNDGSWAINHERLHFTVPDDAMFMAHRPNLLRPYGEGKGHGEALSDELDIIKSELEMERSTFQNNARPDLMVNLEGASADQKEQFEQEWVSRFMGPEKSGKPMVTASQNAELDVQDITPPLKDTIIAELRKLSTRQVIETFGIPPSMVGRIEDTNRATIRTERDIFAVNVTMPRLIEYKDAFEGAVNNIYNEDIRIEFENPRPEDFERKLQTINAKPEAFNYNEIRNLAGYDDAEWGDQRGKRPESNYVEVDASRSEDINNNNSRDTGLHKKSIEYNTRQLSEIEVDEFEPETDTAKQVVESIELSDVDQLESDFAEEIQRARDRQAEDLGEDPDSILPEAMIALLAARWREDRLSAINHTTKQAVGSVIDRRILDGASDAGVLGGLEGYRDSIPTARSAIGPTEMARLQNLIAWHALNSAGLEQKTWISQRDGKVRPPHVDLDGETIPVNEPFRVAGATAQFPGDFGIGELDANCRCFLSRSELEKSLEEQWFKINGEVKEAEERFQTKVNRVLRDQAEMIIETTRQILRATN